MTGFAAEEESPWRREEVVPELLRDFRDELFGELMFVFIGKISYLLYRKYPSKIIIMFNRICFTC